MSERRAKRTLERERDATPRELKAWARANENQLEKDLAEAEASLAKGRGKPWDLVEFLAEAEKRNKKKSKRR